MDDGWALMPMVIFSSGQSVILIRTGPFCIICALILMLLLIIFFSSFAPGLDLCTLGSSLTKSISFTGISFLQKFDIQPVLIRVDYCPHHVDLAALRGGKYVELVNLVPWKVCFWFICAI